MATFNKIEQFVEDCLHGVHDMTNTAAADVTVFLTTIANIPVTTNDILGDITEIAYTNLSARDVTITSSSHVTGLYTLTLTDLVLTATGAVATFRGVGHYADVPTSPVDPLIQWYDHGSDVTLANGETFTIDYLVAGSGGFLQFQ